MRLLLAIFAALLIHASATAQKRIALTFDDAPRAAGAFLTPDQRTKKLIAALRHAKVRQAAFFINSARLVEPDGKNGDAHIADYVRAGHVIANHSFSHPHLNTSTADTYLADIDRAEEWLKGRKGRRPWFRYPFLDEGRADKAKRDAIREGLAARGLKNGYVTVDGYDWAIEQMAIDARKAGKTVDMKALKDLYVETHVGAANYYDALAIKTIGRSPAHVMLLHETDIAALFIGDLVEALRANGWQIISADTAYADPVADEAARYDTKSAQGTLIEMLAWQKGLPSPRWYERNNETVLASLFNEHVLHEKVEAPREASTNGTPQTN